MITMENELLIKCIGWVHRELFLLFFCLCSLQHQGTFASVVVLKAVLEHSADEVCDGKHRGL